MESDPGAAPVLSVARAVHAAVLALYPAVASTPIESILHPCTTFSASYLSDALYAVVGSESYTLVHDISKAENGNSVMVFVKGPRPLRENIPIARQIETLHLPGKPHTSSLEKDSAPNDDPENERSVYFDKFDHLGNLITLAVMPFVDQVSSTESPAGEAARRKLGDAAIAVRQLEQQILVPELLASVPPSVLGVLQDSASPENPQLLLDTAFLNELTRIVYLWVRQAQALAGISPPTEGRHVIDEIHFWLAWELALEKLQRQMAAPEIKVAVAILYAAKRFQVTTAFQNDTGTLDKLEEIRAYNLLLKELPIRDVLHSRENPTDWLRLLRGVEAVFSHLRRWKASSTFPLRRIIDLCELLVQDVCGSVVSLLVDSRIFATLLSEHRSINVQAVAVLDTLTRSITAVTNVVREAIRKRLSKFQVLKISVKTADDLHARLESALAVRTTYESLLQTMSRLDGAESLCKELSLLYDDCIASTDPFDFSKKGDVLWLRNERLFGQEMASLTANATALMDKASGAFESFNEYLSFFISYSGDGLLSSLMSERRKLSLLNVALAEIQDLSILALKSLSSITVYRVAPHSLTDRIVAEVAVLEKAKFYRAGLSKILGPAWNKFSTGNKIDQALQALVTRLEHSGSLQKWIDHTELIVSKFDHAQAVFRIESDKSREYLRINYDPALEQVVLEAETILAFEMVIPTQLVIQLEKLQLIHPLASSLSEHLECLALILEAAPGGFLDRNPFSFLLDEQLTEVQMSLSHVSNLSWAQVLEDVIMSKSDESPTQTQRPASSGFIVQLEENIEKMVQKVHLIEALYDRFDKRCFERLRQSAFSKQSINEILKVASVELTDVNDLGISDSDRFHSLVARKMDQIIVDLFIGHLNKLRKQLLGEQEFRPELGLVHTFSLELMRFHPEVSALKHKLTGFVDDAIEMLHSVLQSTGHVTSEPVNNVLAGVLGDIGTLVESAQNYCDRWLGLVEFLNDPVRLHFTEACEISSNLRVISNFFDLKAMAVTKGIWTIGVLTFEFLNSRAPIRKKIDEASMLISENFKEHVSLRTRSLQRQIEQDIRGLSLRIDFNAASTLVLKQVAFFAHCEEKQKGYQDTLTQIKNCQTFFKVQSILLPPDWIYTEQIESLCSELLSYLSKRREEVFDNAEILNSKIKSQWLGCNDSLRALEAEWEKNKPQSGDVLPQKALLKIGEFLSKAEQIHSEATMLVSVCAVFSMELDQTVEQIFALEADMKDLRNVWSSLQVLWDQLGATKDRNWSNASADEIKTNLKDVLAKTRETPAIVRQYQGFEELQATVRDHLFYMPIWSELKSDFIKKRHWDMLFKKIRVGLVNSDSMRVGHVLDIDFHTHEKALKDILDQAKSERIIEDTLDKLESGWAIIIFETVNFEGKCRLIKNWSAILDQCAVDLNTLRSMKRSPHVSAFERRINEFEGKLGFLSELADVWSEVQRQWVYLAAIFGNNEEVKSTLPVETLRFNNASNEFISLNKKLGANSIAIEAASHRSASDQFQKIHNALTKTQRGLSEYLEKQRQRFARFYFLGNDDLLELIGNKKNMALVNKFISLMFPGVAWCEFDEGDSSVVAIVSPQGERLRLETPVSTLKHSEPSIWLDFLDTNIKLTLSSHIKNLVTGDYENFEGFKSADEDKFFTWLEEVPCQALSVASHILFTNRVQEAVQNTQVEKEFKRYSEIVAWLSGLVEKARSNLQRKKLQVALTEFIHFKQTLEHMNESHIASSLWNVHQHYHFFEDREPLSQVTISHHGNNLGYGYEYYGAPEKIVMTPMVELCFSAMSQALALNLGGSPFGPAGTGKTESVKALGQSLGRLVVVFCCDETFDSQSIGQIMKGVCQIGAWACFDEFNRLESNILSAISTQIRGIQSTLRDFTNGFQVSPLEVNPYTGIFVTMNPGYAGRNILPENLRTLFREFAMGYPDEKLIAEVLLSTQGFQALNEMAQVVISFFEDLRKALSWQNHYDFGLRTLKSVLQRCAKARRHALDDTPEAGSIILARAINESILPKLVPQDEQGFHDLLRKSFPQYLVDAELDEDFVKHVEDYCKVNGLTATPNLLTKASQVLQASENHHGFMLVGPSGSGKSTACRVAFSYAIAQNPHSSELIFVDSKVMAKEDLYGTLDVTTRDWTDGVFTRQLRQFSENSGHNKVVWIVLDGDIDPKWAENLNSVLDDNKLLTLSNGERITLPSNLRVIFETDNLKYATMATISRCGMVWFDGSRVTSSILLEGFFETIEESLEFDEDLAVKLQQLEVFRQVIEIARASANNELLCQILSEVSKYKHVMEFEEQRAMSTFRSFFQHHCTSLLVMLTLNSTTKIDVDDFATKATILSLAWSFAGDVSNDDRSHFSEFLASKFPSARVPHPVTEYRISLPQTDWEHWSLSVEFVELDPQQIFETNNIIPTIDTVIHENIIYGAIQSRVPMILCGPPGSGKTMSLLKALRRMPDVDLVTLNFSKDSSPRTILAALEQHCEYKKINSKWKLCSRVTGKWTVLFCDEINLPAPDAYGTQTAIAFLRQLIEKRGFWRPKDHLWVETESIQFVGACNDPKDPGRHPLPMRLMRHVNLVMLDYPSRTSLLQIYSAFNHAILKFSPDLQGFENSLTVAMIDVYGVIKNAFLSSKAPHYIFSPRELTRWCRGMLNALQSISYTQIDDLVRLWYHEGLRLFYDRLIDTSDRDMCKTFFKEVALKHFVHVNLEESMKEPVLYSEWLSSQYESVNKQSLQQFVEQRLRVFSEEENEVDLIIYDEFLDYALRIDRVLRQHQGHMILVGSHTSGKTTLTKFVAWINGLKIHQLRVNSKYTIADFEDYLRDILVRCAKGEKVCLLIDQSTITETAFLERMNTLLANSEVPGLFENDDFEQLMKLCASESVTQGFLLDSDEELYAWFTNQVSANLHVVFTISDFDSGNQPQVHSSPALFNRCVISWMGDWSEQTLKQVAQSFVSTVSMPQPQSLQAPSDTSLLGFHETLLKVFIRIHHGASFNPPGYFLRLLQYFQMILIKKQTELDDNQRQINVGLDKLKETVLEVERLKRSLSEKNGSLRKKDEEALTVLNKMITEQNEAERKKEFSEVAQEELSKQEHSIRARKNVVMAELKDAEPAVIEAQKGVENIKKQHLTEMRSMSNPPAAIKLCLESVCALLGYSVSSWRDVQLVVRKDDFITSIIRYNNEVHLTHDMREYMESTYLSRPDFNFESVNRASTACGPLLLWVIAQIKYSTVLQKIGPLRDEVLELEAQFDTSRARLIAIAEMIEELEESIELYKSKYSEVIRQTENIKLEMLSIEQKMNRSMQLLASLKKERDTWLASAKTFTLVSDNLVGNAILGAAFLTYSGDLDQRTRNRQLSEWKNELRSNDIPFDDTLSVISTVSTAVDIASWTKSDMDEFFMENLAIGAWSTVPKFVLDPLGEVKTLLSSKDNTVVSSFHEKNFERSLEDAMRFGGHLLLENAEDIDPYIYPLIRQEVVRNGSRKLVQLGKGLIDILDGFDLTLYTSLKVFKSDFVTARTTPINFTVTIGNLENRVLNMALQSVLPELITERNHLISLQSDYLVRIYNLRNQLLTLLNCAGSLLDDDNVVSSLENLEIQTNEIEGKLASSKDVMAKVNAARDEFGLIAMHLQAIYVILLNFLRSNVFYNFSLGDILGVLAKTLQTQHIRGRDFIDLLYRNAFQIFGISLREVDREVFALALALAADSEQSIQGDEEDKLNTPRKEWCSRVSVDQWFADSCDACNMPILLSLSERLDLTNTIEQEAEKRKKRLVVIPMGNKEGLELAKARLAESNSDCWLLIQNIHVSPESLIELDQSLALASYDQGFRVFFTCGLSSRITLSLIEKCRVITVDEQRDFKTTIKDVYDSCASTESNTLRHVFFLLSWYHAIIMERLRYIPLCFSKQHDINKGDALAAASAIRSLFTEHPRALSHPDKVPWQEIRYLVGRMVYGGKILDVQDLGAAIELCDSIFVPASFDVDFQLAPGIVTPEGYSVTKQESLIESIPLPVPSSLLGVSDGDLETLKDERRKEVEQRALAMNPAKSAGN